MKQKRKKTSTSIIYEILDDNPHHDTSTTANINSTIKSLNDNSSIPLTSNTTNSSSSNHNITTQSSDTTNPTTTTLSIRQKFPNRKSSNVWLYATKSEDGKSATCNLCGYVCAVVCHSTSTIRYHLIRQHDKYDLITSRSSPSSKSKVSQHFKDELHSLCYNAIIIDHRPFNDMRKPGLLAIFDKLCPGYLPPHRNQVSNHLKDLYNFHLTALKEQLQNIDYIGLTFDFWTSRRCVSFLCITGHWFDDKCVYFSKVIHFSSFDERHTGFNISRSVKEKLESLGIYHKVVAITCDGGENLVSACSQLDGSIKRIWCCTHRLHLVIINSLGFWNTENKLDNNPTNCLTTEITATATSSSNIISNNQQELMDTSCSDENETGEILIDETIGDAGGHYTDIINNFDTAQGSEAESATIVNAESIDDEQNLDLIDDNWSSNIDTNVPTTNEVELIMDLLKKCRVLATLSKKSSIVSNFIRTNQLLFKVNRTLNNDCKSRWNSTFILLDALIDLKPVMMKLFNEKRTLNLRRVQIEKLTMIELNNEDWDFISSLHSVLKPFYWGTVMMSGKSYPSIGLAYHAVHKIKHFCTNGTTSNNHIKELKKLLLVKLYTYFYDDIEQFQYFQRHAFFDPAAHLSLSDVEKNQCEKYVKNLIYDDVYPQKRST